MRVSCIGTARVKHNATSVIYEVTCDELDWDAVGGDERDMGPKIQYQAVVDHPDLGLLTWSLWEYPVGFQNHRQTDVGGHEIVEDFDYRLEHEPDIWVDYDIPDDPFTIFMDSYYLTGNLLADHGSSRGTDLINRMIFSQQIAALEAYLGDTLAKAVLTDKEAMQRLMAKDSELLKERFSLAEIALEPDLVDRKIQEYLRSILYHNLARVDFLYHAALEVSVLDLARDKALLFTAVKLRHDCVHRNGLDKDGKKIDVFTKQYVQDTADLIKHLVERVENAVRTRAPF